MLHEIKRSKIHTISEFIKEYAMIVVGILTALALEHVVVHEHERQAAEKSRARLVRELRQNLESVNGCIEENKRRQEPLEANIAALESDIRKGLSKADINKHLHELFETNKIYRGVNMPLNLHESWDVVLSDQSLTHVDDDNLHRFASAYASQRELFDVVQEDVRSSTFGTQLEGALIDLKFDQADPMTMLKALMSLDSVFNQVGGPLRAMQSSLTETLAQETKAERN